MCVHKCLYVYICVYIHVCGILWLCMYVFQCSSYFSFDPTGKAREEQRLCRGGGQGVGVCQGKRLLTNQYTSYTCIYIHTYMHACMQIIVYCTYVHKLFSTFIIDISCVLINFIMSYPQAEGRNEATTCPSCSEFVKKKDLEHHLLQEVATL